MPFFSQNIQIETCAGVKKSHLLLIWLNRTTTIYNVIMSALLVGIKFCWKNLVVVCMVEYEVFKYDPMSLVACETSSGNQCQDLKLRLVKMSILVSLDET